MIVSAVVPLLSLVAVLVAAPATPEEGCPSARQVTEAMQGRIPAYLVLPDQLSAIARPDVLRSVVDVASDGTVVRFALVDAHGDTQLRRTLSAPARSRLITECVALAETMAAIVERYLGTISYEAGEPPPMAVQPPGALEPPPPALVSALAADPRASRRGAMLNLGVAWRATSGGRGPQDGLELRLGGQLELTRRVPRLAIGLSLGASPAVSGPLPDAPQSDASRTATFRRFPLRVAAVVHLAAGSGWIEPSLSTGGDLIVLSATAGQVAPAAASTFRFGPVIEAGVGYRVKVGGPVFLRPALAVGVALKRYDTGVQNDPRAGPLATPWMYASVGIDTAVVFR